MDAYHSLRNFDFWEQVAKQIGEHDYNYDLSDDSERLDIVQIVCENAAKVLVRDSSTESEK